LKKIFEQTDNEKILSKLDEILDEIKKLSFTKQEYYVFPPRPSYREYMVPYPPVFRPWLDWKYTPNYMVEYGVDWGINDSYTYVSAFDSCDTHVCLGVDVTS
jgi:hypothetical protein